MAPFRYITIILAVAFLGAAVFVSLIPNSFPLQSSYTRSLPRPAEKWVRTHYGEMRHLPGYFIVTIFVQMAFGRRGRSAAAVMFALLIMAGTLEVIQIWIPHRKCDIQDYLWGTAGIVIGSCPAFWSRFRARRHIPIDRVKSV